MTLPLRARITAATAVSLPAAEPSAEAVSWRAATLDDVPAVTALYEAMAAVDHPDWAEAEAEVEEEFQHSWVDLARDTAIAELEGRIVAFGQVIRPDSAETIVRSILFGGVHPEFRGRGIGRVLLAWQRERALQQLAGSESTLPGWIQGFGEERDVARAHLFERGGFRIARYFSQLERDLAAPIPVVELLPELRLVQMVPEYSERVRVARNDAFRDHWGSQPNSVENWESRAALPTRRNDLSFLAVDADDSVVGLVITDVNEEDFERQGFRGSYISLVGVVRAWRGRGIAPALLAAALQAARDHGFERVVLDVDTESPTGALGLYTGMGFESVSRSLAFVEEH